jgi:hypothetical protein
MKSLKPLRTIVVAFTLVLIGAASAFAQAKIEVVGGDTFDWGKVPPGELTTTIEIRNSGTSTLHISKIQPGCGCTAAPIDKDTLQPGEIGKMSVKLDARTRAGALHKTIAIYSDDPVAPVKMVNLKADIRPVLEFRPAQWFMVNDGKVGAETASTVSIINSGDKPFTVFAPELTSGNVKARFNLTDKQELKPGQELQITAYVTPQAAGPLNGIVRLKTSTKEYPFVELVMYGNVTAAAANTPAPSDVSVSKPNR